MTFQNDHLLLNPPSSFSYSFEGLKLPNNMDVNFRAKQREIVEQYSAARIFLAETECKDWKHWNIPDDSTPPAIGLQTKMRGFFYESALFYYNTIIDLSWTLCYVCAEFSLFYKGERVDFSGMRSIEEAAALLRIAESNVTSPTADSNPFLYLKRNSAEFASAIDMVMEFWNTISDSPMRKKYNYCKHRGKPLYCEIAALIGNKLFGYGIQQQNGETLAMPSDSRDVQWSFSLQDSIAELLEFDNNALYPYLNGLFKELERVVEPSPMIAF